MKAREETLTSVLKVQKSKTNKQTNQNAGFCQQPGQASKKILPQTSIEEHSPADTLISVCETQSETLASEKL